jgi:hypothetical protein
MYRDICTLSIFFAVLACAQEPSVPPQPYDKLITKDAKTTKGVFTVHQIGEKYYYEIPPGELSKDFLWNTRIAKTTIGVAFGGALFADRVVRWELNGNKVTLRDINYDVVADPQTAMGAAVRASNNETIIMSFDVAATSKDNAPVIDVTRLFNSDVSEFNIHQRLGATWLDPSRSWVDRISPYPGNIEVESTLTWTRSDNTNTPGQMRNGSATIVVHHSMVKLPEKTMMPRFFDDRVGYFSTWQYDFSKDEPRAPHVRYIYRWRLEKKDAAAAISDPVRPIVYYIDAATPVKWREWIKKGVESWQPALEAAGFRNAIVARLAPDPKEDPDFSPEDIRNSTIRWLPSAIENSFGPNVHDPRSGEILNADIEFYQNIMNLIRTWYFTQVGPLDPRAAKLPLPDEVMGRGIEYIIAHEVGHTLGLMHNMKASSMYPPDKVHDPEWVHKMGFTPSIMDYARFDYVAQPEDGIPVEDLAQRVGPYDRWAIRWGYSPIAGAARPEDEKPTLDRWAREQDETPWYRFETNGANGADAGELAEAVGDGDAIRSTTLGLKNLRRVAKMLIPATTAQEGQPYDDLDELYGGLLGQWTMEMNHVAAIVGGFDSQTKYSGQSGRVFTPVAKARQIQAVAFLNENAFAVPQWAIDPEILRRIEPAGALNRIRNAQVGILSNLLSSARFTRMVEHEAIDGASAWAPASFLAAVRQGVWKELDQPSVRVDAYRRNLQRAWLDLANNKINGNAPYWPSAQQASGDEKPFYRAELKTLRSSIDAALPRTSNRETREHLEGVRDQIVRILDSRFAQPTGTTTPGSLISIDGAAPLDCFTDFSIRAN